MEMFLSNVVFPPPASGTLTFFLHFCRNKLNYLQFTRRKTMSQFTQFCLTGWGGGCIATPGSPHIPEGLLACEEGCAMRGVLQSPPFCGRGEEPL